MSVNTVPETAPVEQAPELPEMITPMRVDTDPNTPVHNVYELPHGDGEPCVPDEASHAAFTEYAYERFDPRSNGTEGTWVTAAVPRTKHRLERGEGWWISPRVAAAVMVGTTLLANVVGNAASFVADTGEKLAPWAERAKASVSRLLGHQEYKLRKAHPVTTTVPGAINTIEYRYGESVGESTPEPEDVDHLIAELKAHGAEGEKVLGITIEGETSDEWGTDDTTLGKEDGENKKLGIDRAADFGSDFIDEAQEEGAPMPPKVKTTNKEHTLDEETIDSLSRESEEHGLSLRSALAIYQRKPGALPASLRVLLDKHIGSARGVRVIVTYQAADSTVTKYKFVPEKQEEVTPENENKDHDYNLYLGLPLPWLHERKRVPYETTRSVSWWRPGAKPDERWVELYKEVVQPDGTLPRDSWRFSRKYQLLAREDRIDYSLTQRYADANGEERDMRVMFIDHDPTEETVAMYKELLNIVSQMRDGEVAKRWSAIAVYPRAQVGVHANAGRLPDQPYPHHPADIGLDVDKQDPADTLGVAMPALGLVEVHMPENPTAEELHRYLENQAGAMWVSAHELAGHGTDVTDASIHLIPVGAARYRHFRTTSVWANAGREAFDRLPDVDARGEKEFNITRQLVNLGGEIVTVHDRVTGDDPRLGESQSAELLGRKPTQYAGGSAAELYAEVGAQVVSRALIPFSEAGLNVTARDPQLAHGYQVDPQLRQMFIERTGWDPANSRPVNQDEFTLSLASDDPWLRSWMDEARRTPMPNDRITILAGAVALGQTDKAKS